jgi:hypothetical protein
MQLYNGMRNNNSCSKAKTRIEHRGRRKKGNQRKRASERHRRGHDGREKKGGLIKRVRPARGVGEYNTIIRRGGSVDME